MTTAPTFVATAKTEQTKMLPVKVQKQLAPYWQLCGNIQKALTFSAFDCSKHRVKPTERARKREREREIFMWAYSRCLHE